MSYPLHNKNIYAKSGCHVKLSLVIEFLSTTVSQAVIVLQQSSDHSTGQEFSHVAVVIRRVSVNHCFADSNCLTIASDHSTGQ
jgi:hypothetical protein